MNRSPELQVEIEQYLLATLLWWPEEIPEVAGILQPEDFTMDAHGAVYAAMQAMVSKGAAVEPLTLAEFLRASGGLQAAGGEGFVIRELGDRVPPSGVTAKGHAQTIRDAAVRRFLRRDAMAIIEASQDPTRPIEEIAGLAERAAVAATSRRTERGAVVIGSLMSGVLEKLHKQSTGVITGIKTGFCDIDQHTGGLQRTDFIVLGGRPAMGKTSLALDIAGNVAIDGKGVVAFFELEMGRDQLVERLLFSRARVNGQLLKSGRLPERDYPRLAMVTGPVGKGSLYIDDTPGMTPLRMLSECRKIKAKAGGLDLVVVDNLQIMRGDGKFKDKRTEIADVSNNLKRLAKELNIPLIGISHLSRACEMRADPEPTMSDLKETGDIEQDADIVMLLYREEVYKDVDPDRHGEAKVIFAKYRNGETAAKLLRFTPELASFSNWSPRTDEPPERRGKHQLGSEDCQ